MPSSMARQSNTRAKRHYKLVPTSVYPKLSPSSKAKSPTDGQAKQASQTSQLRDKMLGWKSFGKYFRKTITGKGLSKRDGLMANRKAKGSLYKAKSRKAKYTTVGDHLEELRLRLIAIILIILAISLVAFVFSHSLHRLLIAPYTSLTNNKLLLHNVYGSIEILLKVSIMSGITLGLPICCSILWKFVTPALERKTAWVGYFTVAASSILFWLGLWVAWQYIFPLALGFLFQDVLLEGVSPQTTVEKYYSFLFLLHIGSGLVFQLPLLTVVLGWLGILQSSWHKKQWKYVVIVTLLFAAFITPPDPISQLLFAFILLALYVASVFLVWLLERKYK